MRPRFGIIVVTHQSERHVAPLWRSLEATVDPANTAICVVDNGSTDRTVEILQEENSRAKLSLQLIRHPDNPGFARANNLAWEFLQVQVSPEIVVLLNPDTAAQPGWLEALEHEFEDGTVDVAAPLLLLPDGRINSRGNALHFLGMGYVQGLGEDAGQAGTNKPFFSGSGAALALRATALAKLDERFGTKGIFWEELFMYGEDSDLGWRLRLAGLAPHLVPASRIVHDYRFPGQGDETRLFWIERNRYLLLLANFKLPTLLVLLPWIALSELALLGGWWKLYPHRLRLWQAVREEAKKEEFKSHRSRIQQNRLAKDREILRAMTGSIQHGARPAGVMDRLLDAALRGSHRFLCALVWW